MTTEATNLSAKALHERQRHYDRLHHLMRLEWLRKPIPTYSDGRTVPKHEVLTLKQGSEECIRRITEHGLSTNSVSLDDADYLAELDAFAATLL